MIFRRQFAINSIDLPSIKYLSQKKFVTDKLLRGFLYVLIEKGKVEFAIPDVLCTKQPFRLADSSF